MRLFLPILFAAPMLASAGCATVVLTEPIGQPVSREEAMKFQGVWLTPDGEVATVKHVHENKLQIAGVDWKGGKFELVEFTVFVTSEEDRQYVNILDPESPANASKYGLARLIVPPENERDNYYILIYLPNPEPFEKAIEAGQLSGTVKKEKFSTIVNLTAPPEEVNKFVDPLKAGEQFIIDAPIILRRVGSFNRDNK